MESRHARKSFIQNWIADSRDVLPASQVDAADVAIIGIDGVFPGKDSVEEFWRAIEHEERLYQRHSAEYLYARQPDAGVPALVGGLIRAPFDFDPEFFKISQSDAEAMDPQVRLLLMSVHRSIEDAGYTAKEMARGRVGVFIGSEGSEYNELHRASALADGHILNHAGSAVANKLSHHFDFRGPSEAINTMCSSGAFCVYRATELLRQGVIDFAIVGAAKINFSAEIFQSLNRLDITSTHDRCYSFHRSSNGYLRSEGVVTMILTRADRASVARDSVYAKIKSAAVNFNGKDGNSMFSPSRNGQKEVIKECYRRAGVSMSEVAFIEAQGMGNVISDFVEFTAINQAYDELLEEEALVEKSSTGKHKTGNAPVITTIKPIAGHMECTSALGALLKIILSLRTRTIFRIPFLAPEDINEKLEAHAARCRLATHNSVVDASRPMLAALHSFGASGTNVHILLEEAVAESDARAAPASDQLLPVSAVSVASLNQCVAAIASFLRAGAGRADIADLCHAFQRREHYAHRVLFHIEAGTPETQAAILLASLEQYLADGVMHEIALPQQCLRWLAGEQVDWGTSHGGVLRKRSRLPGYRFDLRTCKLALTNRLEAQSAMQVAIHPLLQRNTSDLLEQRYRSTFNGDEFFLADHQVRGEKILPAVAYLEMARAAVTDAAGDCAPGSCLELRDVVWLHPLIARGAVTVNIRLHPDDGVVRPRSGIHYQIFSQAPDEEELVHCDGTAVLTDRPEPAVLDLRKLNAEMTRGELAPADLYRAFERMQMHYGAAHRGVVGIKRGDAQLLAHVSLPDCAAQTANQFALHPAVMDSALQTSLALLHDLAHPQDAPSLPFALESVTILATCTTEMYVWLRPSPGSSLAASVVKLDADVCDHTGNVCVRLRGFSSRRMHAGEPKLTTAEPAAVADAPTLQPHDAAHSDSLREKSVGYFQRLLGQVLKADARRVKAPVPFSDLGLDSVRVVQLTQQLRQNFSGLTTTLFFEVRNIDGLVDHLLVHNRQELADLLATPATGGSATGGSATGGSATAVPKVVRKLETRLRPVAPARDTAQARSFEVAIVGLSGRYPKARTLEELWTNLCNGVNCIAEVPANRWNWRSYYSPERGVPGKIYSRWGGFLDGVDEFDPLFFRIPPIEAERMDPQERLFLMCAYHAIEDAGYSPASLCADRKVGVFVGVMNSPYASAPDHFSFANRASYLFDFLGPSMAVDTACSSSLTAIHLALESIRSGSSTSAIAGGVNLILKPAHYQRLADISALSSSDKCRAFGAHADGLVDAEGVGVVVLKALEQAEKDGDHIYGVIRGSAVNAGGRTIGYSVPNPAAQSAVIVQAMKDAGVAAEDISYVEAHGTGTALGDPIEIAGLSRAFGAGTDRKQFCAIGSLKSNIGHCESAAGIAGLTKVLLQFGHGQLVPSLHCDVANPQIDFSATPFKVQTSLAEWRRPQRAQNGVARELPRIAGLSSFGMGGANAHLIVQEYRCTRGEPEVAPTPPEVVVPLSARTAEQLLQKAQALLEFVSARRSIDLRSMAYTLQVGREPMEERLGLVVRSVDQLIARLKAYVGGERQIAEVVRGSARADQPGMELISHESVRKTLIERCLEHKEFSSLLQLWTLGVDVDWCLLYPDAKPRRMSLPGYPFAAERYWSEPAATPSASHAAETLHALVHRNISDLTSQRYGTLFTGDESFLRDHRIAGESVVPAVVYLEMARAAAVRASHGHTDECALELRNVVWGQPAKVNQHENFSIELVADEQGKIGFEIACVAGDAPVVHCQGQVVFAAAAPDKPAIIKLDVERLRGEMRGGRMEAASLYELFAQMEIQLGESHRGVVSVDRGESQLLGHVRLPEVVVADRERYVLHPSLMDSALHASAPLLQSRGPLLPFALEKLSVIRRCPQEMLVWARRARVDDGRADDALVKLDIDLCDLDGNVCVQMQGFSARAACPQAISAPLAIPEPRPEPPGGMGTLLAVPVWKASPVEASETGADFQQHVVLCELTEVSAEQIAACTAVQCVALSAPRQTLEQRYTQYALRCFEHVQALVKSGARANLLLQLVVADGVEHSVFAGLSGLLRSVALEHPQIQGQVILTDPAITTDQLVAQLNENRARPQEALIRYTRGMRHVLAWEEVASQEVTNPPHAAQPAFKEGGVYLITGGLGGLGTIFAQEILAQTRAATVVLTGRSEPTEEKLAALAGLPSAGHTLIYRVLDLESAADVERVVSDIVREFGSLDGVLHSAGMTADSLLLKKTAAQFARVLGPKVTGTVHLDAATRHLDLDFFVLFSSGASVLGNAGQSDYAAANGFLDRFAEMRNQLTLAGDRKGRTLAINWPYWREGGMRIDARTEAAFERALGVRPMGTANGLQAFHRCVELGCEQALVLDGDRSRLRQALNPAAAQRVAAPMPAMSPAPMLASMEAYLKQQFATVFKLPMRELDAKAPLEKYGIDSILAMKLTNHLEVSFGSLPKTLLFEYRSIEALAAHLSRAYPGVVAGIMAASDVAGAALPPPPARAAMRARRSQSLLPANATTPAAADDIAIIGISGRYPMAQDLDEFWQNLKDGRDCVTEIPRERWDHARYFHPDKNRAGKSYSKWGGFLADVDKFDAQFFSVSPKEAQLIDPQERLFIETAWHTLEDAGYSRASVAAGKIGVYVGVMWGHYELLGAGADGSGGGSLVPGSSYASIANRVSYFFDFHGPSLAIDTMCSSSLTAIHLACEELRRGEIDAAIAGGVNVCSHPNKYVHLSQGNFASTDGRCRSFGQGGDGYVPGEGVGAVLLKPLAQALRDGDRIHAVIKSSTINHGGKTNGYTVPNPSAQADLIAKALEKARIDPRTLGYVEAHGTGTSLGDPIEIAGLANAFERDGLMRQKQFCPIGSVKSNIGHLESAAGIAAVTKSILQIKHGQLVPSLYADRLNPYIGFAESPFYVQTGLAQWPRPAAHPRRIAVSSFGAGGANAHLILEEHVLEGHLSSGEGEPQVFVISAKDAPALGRYVEKTLRFLGSASSDSLADLAYTSQVGRTPLNERLAVVACGIPELKLRLEQWAAGRQAGQKADNDSIYCGNASRSQAEVATLLDGDVGDSFVAAILAERDPRKFAQLWVSGVNVDWQLLQHGAQRRRVSLPAYPFARERHWIETSAAPAKVEPHISADELIPAAADASLLERTREYLQRLIGAELKLAPERVDPDARFESFGMDSIGIGRITSELQRELGTLPATALYQHETVGELASFLSQQMAPALGRMLHVATPATAAAPPPLAVQSTVPPRENPKPQEQHSDQIAVVGMHGYFPGSANLDEFWENLRKGKTLVGFVPPERWNYREFYDPDPAKAVEGKIYCKWGAFIEDCDRFDAGLFNISPEEARAIDPQERLFLQSTWAALEDAGYTRERLKKQHPKGRSAHVGVFVGVTTNSYQLAAAEECNRGNKVVGSAAPWSIANRVSYFFDFQGPSMPVDTACSSSLVALHLACESLKRKECQVAIAGGVNLYLHPSKYQSFCERRMVSLDGKCRSFGAGPDEGEDGFVPGECIGTLVLKPLRRAIEDGDAIHAVVLASAFEHSGRSNGYSAPNPNSQADLIAQALENGRIHPETIGYIEGHGTGTRLGDSLELAALSKAFQQHTGQKQFCAVGSIKANIGHAESAAGIAGITKVILQMKHRRLAPTLHCEGPNPDIDFASSPFYLQREEAPWEPRGGHARRALINSFGAGGVNACVVLEEYAADSVRTPVPGPHLFPLSARTESGLREYAARLLTYLSSEPDVDLARLGYTLQAGREASVERLGVVAASSAELGVKLRGWLEAQPGGRVHRGSVAKAAARESSAREPAMADAASCDLDQVAARWCEGERIGWERLYSGKPPAMLRLPTYPFARERHWLAEAGPAKPGAGGESALHPLVSRNSSTLQTVRLDSTLSPDDFYSKGHQVNGERIFPGAGFLEIACIAGQITSERKICRINDVVWAQPLSFRRGSRVVQTSLRIVGDHIEYDITSNDERDETVVHSEGRLRLQDTAAPPTGAKQLSIQELLRQHGERKDGAHYYRLFERLGLDYGPSFRSIQECYTNGSSALARVKIADELKADFTRYLLHPSVIDAAFQTIAGLLDTQARAPHLPFALDELEIFRPIPQHCWAYARRSEMPERKRAALKKFDIDLLSDRGDTLVMLKGLYLRPVAIAALPHGDAILVKEDAQ